MSACKVCGGEAFGTYFCDDHAKAWAASPECRASLMPENIDSMEAYNAQVDAFSARMKETTP